MLKPDTDLKYPLAWQSPPLSDKTDWVMFKGRFQSAFRFQGRYQSINTRDRPKPMLPGQ